MATLEDFGALRGFRSSDQDDASSSLLLDKVKLRANEILHLKDEPEDVEETLELALAEESAIQDLSLTRIDTIHDQLSLKLTDIDAD